MKIQEFLTHFKGVKCVGDNKYMVLCPVHSDKKQSLSIGLSENEKQILINCFASCETEEILRRIGLKMSDLYTETISNQIVEENTYSYFNKSGDLVYRKLRKDFDDTSKKFYFEQPNGKKGVKGIKRVVYNLPSVLQSPKIYFVEGEKCADILNKNGLTATTLDSGANSVWQNDFNEIFKDKEVIIIIDNDEAGRKYGKMILEHLSNATVIILPDLKEKEDIYDWLMAGHTVEELENLPRLSNSDFISIYFQNGEEIADDNTKNKSQAEILLDLVKETNATLFHDTANDVFASVEVEGHLEVWNINSSDFNIWLNGLFFKGTDKPIKKDSLSQALAILSAKARFDNKEAITLSNRVAERDNAFWYDLTNSSWQSVKITAEGWVVEDNTPILFNRYRHQLSQVLPSRGGDVRKILKYINIKDNKTLFLCWLISCYVPEIPHAMPVFYGEKGSAKSTACTLLKKLIDPSALETLTLQKNSRSLAINLQHHWFLPFDNVSVISEEVSDTLCRAITGGGIQQRRLYSDADDYIFTFKRCLALNGINNVATRPDLLDRAILVELRRISEDNRKELNEIMLEFKKDLPYILGGIFDILSKAIRIFPTVKLDILPRMADFTRWGYAIGEALGNLGETFINEYATNREHQNIEVLNYDVVATLMVEFMKDKVEWKGKMSQLHSELSCLAPELGINTKLKAFPAYPNVLSRKLNGLQSNLQLVGIVFVVDHKADGSHITLQNSRRKTEKISSLPPYHISFTHNGAKSDGDNSAVIAQNDDYNNDIITL